jgi:hypothetical protein
MFVYWDQTTTAITYRSCWRFIWEEVKKEAEAVKVPLKLQCLCTKQVIIHLGIHATSISRET